MKTLKNITRHLSAFAVFIAAMATQSLAAAVFISSDPSDFFNSIGQTSGGEIRIAGSRQDQAGYFTYTGSGFTFTPLAPLLDGGLASAYRISRDGQYVVGTSDSPNTFGAEAVLWNLSSPSTPLGLGFLSSSPKDSTGFGIGLQSGAPIVVGSSISPSGGVGYKWTSSDGMIALPKSDLPAPVSAAYGISGDGSVWTGNEDPVGLNSYRAVVGNSSGVSVLNSLGNPFSQANNISYDGTVVVGKIGQQAAFWNVSTLNPTLLTLDGNPLIGEALAYENGFVVGKGNGFGWIADASGTAQRIDDWLLNNYGVTLGHQINAVNDIFVSGGNFYLGMEGSGVLVQGEIAAVPEPAGASMVAAALLSLFAFGRFIRRRSNC